MEKRPPLHLGVVAIEKGAFGSLSTMVANFNLLAFKLNFKIYFWHKYKTTNKN